MKKLVALILSALMFVSCAKKNPLIRQDVISALRSETFWSGDFPVEECAAFYAKYVSTISANHKEVCDEWAARRLNSMLEGPFGISKCKYARYDRSEIMAANVS